MKNTNRNIIIVLVIILIAAIGIFYWYSSSKPGIKFPAGGETLIAGKTYTLKWNGKTSLTGSSTAIFLVDNALISQGASVSIIDRVYDVSDTGSYDYTIPAAVSDSDYFFVIGTTTSNKFIITSTP